MESQNKNWGTGIFSDNEFCPLSAVMIGWLVEFKLMKFCH